MPLPFSASAAVAAYVREGYPPDTVVVGDPNYVASSVAGCLGRELYYPATDAFGTYVVWDATRPVDYPVVQQRTLDLLRRQPPGRRVLLLTNYLLPPNDLRFRQVEQFGASVVPDEVYVLYEVSLVP